MTVSVGHCHPEVVAAVQQQSSRLQHTTTIYLNDQVALYARELAERMPGNLKVSNAGAGDGAGAWASACVRARGGPGRRWMVGPLVCEGMGKLLLNC